MPAVYRARISALRSTCLGVLGDCGVGGSGEPKFRRFTSAETASSKVKIKLPSALKACGSRCPIGALEAQTAPRLEDGQDLVTVALQYLYHNPSPRNKSLTIAERDAMIRTRHAAGKSQAELARQFGISYQRVHQIVHGRRK